MTDYFSLLGELRRPWLDPDSLKKKFLSLRASVHPDRVHNEGQDQKEQAQGRYTELNQAYQQLRSPKDRLQHLLELETGAKPQQVQAVPSGLMEFFFRVAQLFKQTDAFLVEKARTSSPLLQVQLFETGQAWVEELKALQQQLASRQESLVAQLKEEDDRWTTRAGADQSDRSGMLKRLDEPYRLV